MLGRCLYITNSKSAQFTQLKLLNFGSVGQVLGKCWVAVGYRSRGRINRIEKKVKNGFSTQAMGYLNTGKFCAIVECSC